MAIGIIFSELTPGYKPNLTSFLFGNILLISDEYLYFLAFISVIVVLSFILFYNKMLAISFDEDFAKINNVNVELFRYYFIILVSISTILLIKVSGLIMVISLLTVPIAIAKMFFNSVKSIMFFSIILSFGIQVVSMYVSFILNISTGPVIIFILSIIYFIFKIGGFIYVNYKKKTL